MVDNKESDGSWIVDTGATNHMTSDQNLFEIKAICDNEPHVTIPNGDSVPVKGNRFCHLLNGIKLENVWYILRFKYNLLSVMRLTIKWIQWQKRRRL